MIALAPSVAYIHEPFNPGRRPGLCGAPIDKWFTYICKDNEQEFYPGIEKTLQFRFDPASQWHKIDTLRAVAGTGKVCANFLRYRLFKTRALLKDPMALFSTQWLADRFDMNVVLMIRHPAAVASSVRELHGKALRVPRILSDILNQPLLIRDHLSPFEKEIKELAIPGQDVLVQSALLWKLIYHVVLKYKEQNPHWIFVRYMDLSLDPVNVFRELFRQLGLEYGDREVSQIGWYCAGEGLDNEEVENPWAVRRNTLAHLYSWRNRLTGAEIARIRSQVQEVAQHFYTDKDW
jgi:hypothetical protein